jgi:hypothetical protein
MKEGINMQKTDNEKIVYKTVFHGTTYENFISILTHGFNPEKCNYKTWNCSENDTIYFYEYNMIKKNYCSSDDPKEYIKEECIRQALSNAQFTASIQNSQYNKLVVFELKVNEKYLTLDYSCENMKDSAMCADCNDLQITDIKAIYISESAYIPSMRLFYISSLWDNNVYLNHDNFNDCEMKALSILAKQELYIEEFFEFEWQKMDNNELKKLITEKQLKIVA